LANHPDVSPAHEALQLVEAFREFARLPEVQAQEDQYRQHVAASLEAAEILEQALRQPHRNDNLLQQIETSFQIVKTKCADCHKQYRD
jgi:cytochrome c556